MSKEELRERIIELREDLLVCSEGEIAIILDNIERLRRELIDIVIGI